MAGRKLPSLAQLRQANVSRPEQIEGIWQPLYDYQTYALAGTTQSYTFFALQLGQSGKTKEDTNIEVGGSLPAGKSFLAEAIQVVMLPSIAVSAQGAQAVDAYLNDVKTLGQAGFLEFFVSSKTYLTDAPIGVFTQQFGLAGFASAADTTTAGAALQHRTAYAVWRGARYDITPIRLKANMNFNVTLNFPSTTAISANMRIGVRLDGHMYREG